MSLRAVVYAVVPCANGRTVAGDVERATGGVRPRAVLGASGILVEVPIASWVAAYAVHDALVDVTDRDETQFARVLDEDDIAALRRVVASELDRDDLTPGEREDLVGVSIDVDIADRHLDRGDVTLLYRAWLR